MPQSTTFDGIISSRSLTSFPGLYSLTDIFVAKLTDVARNPTNGQWTYEWVEQDFNAFTGLLQDCPSGKTGDLTDGPYLYHLNNSLINLPAMAWIRLRGVADGQPIYEFDSCGPCGSGSGSGEPWYCVQIDTYGDLDCSGFSLSTDFQCEQSFQDGTPITAVGEVRCFQGGTGGSGSGCPCTGCYMDSGIIPPDLTIVDNEVVYSGDGGAAGVLFNPTLSPPTSIELDFNVVDNSLMDVQFFWRADCPLTSYLSAGLESGEGGQYLILLSTLSGTLGSVGPFSSFVNGDDGSFVITDDGTNVVVDLYNGATLVATISVSTTDLQSNPGYMMIYQNAWDAVHFTNLVINNATGNVWSDNFDDPDGTPLLGHVPQIGCNPPFGGGSGCSDFSQRWTVNDGPFDQFVDCVPLCGSSGSGEGCCFNPAPPDTLYAHFQNTTGTCTDYLSGKVVQMQFQGGINLWMGSGCIDDPDGNIGGYFTISMRCDTNSNSYITTIVSSFCGSSIAVITDQVCDPFSITCADVDGELAFRGGGIFTNADCSNCNYCTGTFDIIINAVGSSPYIDPSIVTNQNPIVPCSPCELPTTLYYCRVGDPCGGNGCTGYTTPAVTGTLTYVPPTGLPLQYAWGHWESGVGGIKFGCGGLDPIGQAGCSCANMALTFGGCNYLANPQTPCSFDSPWTLQFVIGSNAGCGGQTGTVYVSDQPINSCASGSGSGGQWWCVEIFTCSDDTCMACLGPPIPPKACEFVPQFTTIGDTLCFNDNGTWTKWQAFAGPYASQVACTVTGCTGSGSGSGCSPAIVRTSKGKTFTGALVNTLSLTNITIVNNDLLVVVVGTGAGDYLNSVTVTWGGQQLTEAIFADTPVASSSGSIHIFYVVAIGGTHDVVVTINGGGTTLIGIEAIQIAGVNSLDITCSHTGLASKPDTGSCGPTNHACEYVQAAFMMIDGTNTWTWDSPFTTGGQDNLITTAHKQSEGYDVLSAIGSVDAAITISPNAISWAGVIATFYNSGGGSGSGSGCLPCGDSGCAWPNCAVLTFSNVQNCACLQGVSLELNFDAPSCSLAGSLYPDPCGGNVDIIASVNCVNGALVLTISNQAGQSTQCNLNVLSCSPLHYQCNIAADLICASNNAIVQVNIIEGCGGNIVRTSKGTGLGNNVLVISNVSIAAGDLIIVNAGGVGGIVCSGVSGVTFAGTALTLAAKTINSNNCSIWYMHVLSATTGSVIVNSSCDSTQASVVQVAGLALNAFDQKSTGSSVGNDQPDSGMTPSLTAADEYCQAVFTVNDIRSFNWTNGFTSGGQDITSLLTFTEGFEIITAGSGTGVEAKLTGFFAYSSPYWTGCVATFK